MTFHKLTRTTWPLTAGLLLFVVLWWGLRQAGAGAAALERPEDPVVVVGADLPALDGQPINELVLQAHDGSNWQPIPFQIDERLNDITGTYVLSEDGLLDANDELVFMAKDAGQLAAADNWPNDPEARANPRYQLAVTDPLDPDDMGWAYLYRSTTLSTTATSYVNWDQPGQTITAISYTASFTSTWVGLADLAINGNGVDILDRQKTRITAFILNLDEEDLATLITPTITIPVVGPVRGVANGGNFNVSIYGARFDFYVVADTSAIPFPIDDLRISLDLNNPAVTNVTNYYNSNGAAVTIDGAPDVVAASPAMSWWQTSGSAGGLVVALPTVNTGGGTVTNYYKDDNAIDPNDTGDQRSYGDSGLFVTDPGTTVEFALVSYVLPPGTTTNVGAAYFARVTNPLTTAATLQTYGSYAIFLPYVVRP
ncbi:MAG: hypothetical protein L0331_12905 [Chloroflexi bacterium]|nr:hypothetical protein [Chloroflexota bacterium]MCI0643764.1 hypothetical protein [Chloroflexota bacterium]